MNEPIDNIGEVEDDGFLPWNPHDELPTVSASEVQYSKGFLQCKPELWFPGFSAHWLPLLHSLDLKVELTEVRPVQGLEKSASQMFIGSLDDEILALLVPASAFEFISRVYVPAANLTAKHFVVEYFARRFLTSLAHSWSGNDSGLFRFEQEMSFEHEQFTGGVRCVFQVNGEEFSLQIGLGAGLVERLDQLWTGQIAQGAGGVTGSLPAKLILGGSAVSPSEIGEVIAPGKNIPVIFGGLKESYIFLHDEPWMKGSLCSVDESLGFRTIEESEDRLYAPPGTTQILFEAGNIELTRMDMMLMSQRGAIHLVPEARLSKVDPYAIHIIIGGQKVAEGSLVTCDSQLFVQVAEPHRG